MYTKTDKNTRFLDAIYSRGRAGGRVTIQSPEFILANSYELDTPSQPDITEYDSMTAPSPETTTREQESNVIQIFQRSVAASYTKMGGYNALSGVNLAGVQNNIPNELEFQIDRRIDQIRMDLNYTLINGVYQFTRGTPTASMRSRGILEAVTTNKFDAAGEKLSKNLLNDAILPTRIKCRLLEIHMI